MTIHCTKCHHEWQGTELPSTCDWCGAPGERIGTDWTESKSVFDLLKEILTVTGDDVLVITKDKEDK